ncbi:MAG TPA: SDR family oxidoreductase [Conexibacter sp.]|nr:SDR family oxidoreductase [Conexibacter sp.]
MWRFADKVAVVTGGASGIGAATARELAAEGARVAILDVDADGGRRVAGELEGAEALTLDVSDRDACRRALEDVAKRWRRIDCLVNGAASFVAKGLDATTEDWERSLGVNVRGYANMVQACAAHMAPGSAIVNVASISAHVAQPDRWTYNASKGAIVALSKCQALDLSSRGIRVNVVSPGWIWTPEVDKAAGGERDRWGAVWGDFHMLRRLGEPREVARAILFLCSDDASFVTAAELMVDGGYSGMSAEGLGERSQFAGGAS